MHTLKTLKNGFIKRDILIIFLKNSWKGLLDALQVMKKIVKSECRTISSDI